ncbi:MAG: LysM peptidoglycan-binding domain-containing protein, partial [Myxococcota bacterium]|nr:LysM peptidoglycan-binding domain-containing protein [Myxococcota bacterium]
DPYLATLAAARLLEQNHRVTGSWPLAITAYNHGASGMRRAVRKLGTRDIERIIREYKGRTFGFASRNFYVEFVAASRIAKNPEEHFGPFVPDTAIDYDQVEIPFYGTPSSLAEALGVPIDTLRTANPALRPSVWRGDKRIPRGFNLKVPRAELSRPMKQALQSVPSGHRHARQTRDAHHVVQRGETLSGIAQAYGLRVTDLQALNGLRSRHRIRAGQKLRLPGDRPRAASTAASRQPGSQPSALPSSGRYTIQRGDTLQGISRRFGVSEKELTSLNGLKNPNRIQPGQVLQLRRAPARPQNARIVQALPRKKTGGPPPASLAAPATGTPAPATDDSKNAGHAFAEVAAEAGQSRATDTTGLLADPNDYSVGHDGTIEVQAMETLGHYAEWLGIRASRLRSINQLKYGQPLPVHSRLRLDFSRARPEDFERHRLEYHQGIQEDFFSEWEISGTEFHRLERGDSLWVLSHRRFNVPLWLLRQYNPDVDFNSPPEGARITVPVLKRRGWIENARTRKVKQGLG